MILKHLFLSAIISLSLTLDAIENSIIPLLEKFTSIENLPRNKFTTNQFKEIAAALQEQRIRLVSYNMLFNLYDQDLAEENRWENRLPRVVELIREMNPDIINSQELWPDQLAALASCLGDYCIVYDDKGAETFAIFFKKERFELLDSEIAKPLVKAKLKDRITEKIVAIFNTHLAFSNIEKREIQAKEIVDKVASEKSCPSLFAGDLNTFPSRLENKKLPFYDGDYILRLLTSKNLKNTKELALVGLFGPQATFTNSPDGTKPFQGTGTPGVYLDHVLTTEGVKILTYAVQPGTVDGHYPSDHLPVAVDFILE